jgi:hypothetical protein
MTSRYDRPQLPLWSSKKLTARPASPPLIRPDLYELLYVRRKVRLTAAREYVVMACNAGDENEVATIHVFKEHIAILEAHGVDLGAIVRDEDNSAGSIPEGVYVRITGPLTDARIVEVV